MDPKSIHHSEFVGTEPFFYAPDAELAFADLSATPPAAPATSPLHDRYLPANAPRETAAPTPSSTEATVHEGHDVRDRAIEMGLGYVVENNAALQEIAESMAGSGIGYSTSGRLNIRPAWEVDYFRWPRIARRLLKMHVTLFEQIGTFVESQTQPTQRRIGVCSTFSGEGTSTMATCLARWSATAGRQTLLVDADIDRPNLTIASGLEIGTGWIDALSSELPVSEVMVRSVESGLVFVPGSVDASPEIHDKSLETLAPMLFQMKYEFDTVFVDLGTVENALVHGTANMDLVDFMVIVRDPATTSVGQLMDSKRMLEDFGVRRSVVTENFAHRPVAGTPSERA